MEGWRGNKQGEGQRDIVSEADSTLSYKQNNTKQTKKF